MKFSDSLGVRIERIKVPPISVDGPDAQPMLTVIANKAARVPARCQNKAKMYLVTHVGVDRISIIRGASSDVKVKPSCPFKASDKTSTEKFPVAST